MREADIEPQVDDAVDRIGFDCAARANALGRQAAPVLARAIEAVVGGAPRVIAISARGPIFCAGGDIGEFAAAGEAVHPPDTLAGAAAALVQRLRAAAPQSLAALERLCGGYGSIDPTEHLALQRRLLEQCAATADGREGVRAFVEKRAPRFQGHRAAL